MFAALIILGCVVASEFATNTNSTQPTTPTTKVTWTKKTILDSHNRDKLCENCTNLDFHDPQTESQSRKRRKRRRNRKPYTRGRGARRMQTKHSHKKHSTRVRLDRPIQFHKASDLEENVVNESDTDPKFIQLIETTTQSAITIVPPPVRYLLPPFVDQYFTGNMATSNQGGKNKPKYEIQSNGRGSTKFKNTIYYRENEIDVLNNEIRYTSVLETIRPDFTSTSYKSEFRPIVVQPTMPILLPENVTNFTDDANHRKETHTINNASKMMSQHVGNSKTSRLVSEEVANAGMQIISTHVPKSSAPQQHEFQLGKVQQQDSFRELTTQSDRPFFRQQFNSNNEKFAEQSNQKNETDFHNVPSLQHELVTQNYHVIQWHQRHNQSIKQNDLQGQLQRRQQTSQPPPVMQNYQYQVPQQEVQNRKTIGTHQQPLQNYQLAQTQQQQPFVNNWQGQIQHSLVHELQFQEEPLSIQMNHPTSRNIRLLSSQPVNQNYQHIPLNETTHLLEMGYQPLQGQQLSQRNHQTNPNSQLSVSQEHDTRNYGHARLKQTVEHPLRQQLANHTHEHTIRKTADEFTSQFPEFRQSEVGRFQSTTTATTVQYTQQPQIRTMPVLIEYETTNKSFKIDKEHQANVKGLDLAESQYFSDLLLQQEVSSFFQNGEYG